MWATWKDIKFWFCGLHLPYNGKIQHAPALPRLAGRWRAARCSCTTPEMSQFCNLHWSVVHFYTIWLGWCLFLNSWFVTLEPPVFELPLACWFQNCFCFQDWTYFSGSRKLFTTQNLKNCLKAVFNSSKSASWCTECNAKKPQLFTKYGFYINLELPPKITIF